MREMTSKERELWDAIRRDSIVYAEGMEIRVLFKYRSRRGSPMCVGVHKLYSRGVDRYGVIHEGASSRVAIHHVGMLSLNK